MKTELLHSYSSASLAAIARSDSSLTLSQFEYDQNPGGPTATFQTGDDPPSKCEAIGNCVKDWWGKACRRKTLEKKFPIIRWLPKYDTEKLVADIVAGFTVGLTILPQGLAYATVGGLPPQYGLYSGFVGCFVYILLGGTGEVTVGPTAVMAIITFTYTHGKPPAYAVILCFLTGIVTLLMGVFQLGFIVNFISAPVNSAFTSAAAITICATQIKGLFGLKFAAEGFLPTVKGATAHITEVKFWDSILSLICIAALLFLMKLQLIFSFLIKRVPILNKPLWFISTARNAIIVIVCTAIASGIGETQPFTIVGKIVPGLPDFTIPPFTIIDPATNVTHSFTNILEEEASAVIVMPLLAIMEHITIAKAFAGENTIDASQEMMSIGVSNIIGAFFSSMPVTGSFSRTTVNAMSGAKSPLGGLITGTIVILALRFLTPYFYYIPKASLAAVIVCAVAFTIDIDIIKPMWRSKRFDVIPWVLTFLVSLFVGLEFGMLTGFLISVIYLLYYAARPGVKVKKGYSTSGKEFLLVEMDRSLTFPSVEYIRYVISKASQVWGQNKLPVVINCLHIQFADYTAAVGIKEVIGLFKKRDQQIILWQVKPSIVRVLSGVLNEPGRDEYVHFCRSEEEVESIIDGRCTLERKVATLQTMDMDSGVDVHTPHPTHREKYNSIPIN
ncbi:Sodium-independent sulfate anion transporter [Orchesella cincta]|uniref:Sodium-independent sulfate anion transporter n=1 Tax=Orchesella cincta TaxID=48709 RepID=A0A1D2MU47_ORCCI|nr:Sodium-independent sulfate anion transporter [Orchesella cincta]